MEFLYNFYQNIFFVNRSLATMDLELTKFNNLRTLKLCNNRIRTIQNMPPNIVELFLNSNQVKNINPRCKSDTLQYLGLGFNQVNDSCLGSVLPLLLVYLF